MIFATYLIVFIPECQIKCSFAGNCFYDLPSHLVTVAIKVFGINQTQISIQVPWAVTWTSQCLSILICKRQIIIASK